MFVHIQNQDNYWSFLQKKIKEKGDSLLYVIVFSLHMKSLFSGIA